MRPPRTWPTTVPPDDAAQLLALVFRICHLASYLGRLPSVHGPLHYASVQRNPRYEGATSSSMLAVKSGSTSLRCSADRRSSGASNPVRASHSDKTSWLAHAALSKRSLPRTLSIRTLSSEAVRTSDTTERLQQVSKIQPTSRWHWLLPLESAVDADVRERLEAEIQARCESPANFHSETVPADDLRSRRLADADGVWRTYRQHAHKASLPIGARLQVADLLSLCTWNVSENMEHETKTKMIRFGMGRRLAAIVSDCEDFLSSNSQDEQPTSLQLCLTTYSMQALALQCRPLQAIKDFEKCLTRWLPQYLSDLQNALDTGSDRSETTVMARSDCHELQAIAKTLSTILHSMFVEVACRPRQNQITRAYKRIVLNFDDQEDLKSMFEQHAAVPETGDFVQLVLDMLSKAPSMLLIDRTGFQIPRRILLKGLARIENLPHRFSSIVLESPGHESPGHESPGQNADVAKALSLSILAQLRYGSKELTFDLVDLAETHAIPLSDDLARELIAMGHPKWLKPRVDAFIKRLVDHTNEESLKRGLSYMQRRLLGTITRYWAFRGHRDYAQIFLSEVLKRQDPADRGMENIVEMALSSRRGDSSDVTERLSRDYDLEAVTREDVAEGKQLLDAGSILTLIRSYAQENRLEDAEQLLNHALSMRLAIGPKPFNLVIGMYIRRNCVDDALSIVSQMMELGVRPDEYTYTILLRGLVFRKDPEGAAFVLRLMVSENVAPDRTTYNSLLRCYVDSGLTGPAIDLFQWMQRHPAKLLRPTIDTCNLLLKLYVQGAFPVQDVFKFVAMLRERGLEPNSHTFALMLQSACDANLLNVAEKIFTEIERKVPPPPGRPSGQGAGLYHFSIMVHAYLRVGDNGAARDYFDEMRARGIEPSHITWSILISNYARSDNETNYKLARQLVMSLLEDENNTWSKRSPTRGAAYESVLSPLLTAEARRRDLEAAEATMEALGQFDSGMWVHTMTPLLDAYRKAGDVDKGLNHFKLIYDRALSLVNTRLVKAEERLKRSPTSLQKPSLKKERVSIDSSAQTAEVEVKGRRQDVASRNLLCLPISIVIDMLAVANRHDEVAKIWAQAKADGFRFDSHNWNHFATAMANGGHLDEALSVIEHVLVEPRPRRDLVEEVRMKRSMAVEDEELPGSASALPNQKKKDPYTYNVSSLNFDADAAQNRFPDGVRAPTAPPNRRHQNRVDDDPNAKLPFDANTQDSTFETDDATSKSQAAAQEKARRLRLGAVLQVDESESGRLTRPLLKENLNRLSPWYAHFSTLTAIYENLEKLESRAEIGKLLNRYPHAGQLLIQHEGDIERHRTTALQAANQSAFKRDIGRSHP